MAKKRKISIRKILQAAFTFVVAVCCIVAMVSASRMEDNKTLTRIDVHINNVKKYHFIEEKQILDEAINNRHIDAMHIAVGRLDMQGMEQALKADPWVADAQLYIDNEKVLHMIVTQRLPIARIFEQGGYSYYLDTTLNTMPLSPNCIYYTSVVTNMPVLKNDSVSRSVKAQVAKMVRTIQADTFWNAQISQVIIDSDNTFELIPVLGDQRVIFGDTSRIQDKLNNLYAFYKGVLNKIGWEHYETLDVRFKGQVVAMPALPNKGPVDKAIANMNWVNSIVETEARRDSLREAAEPKQAVADAKADSKNKVKETAEKSKKDVKKPGKDDHAAKAKTSAKGETKNKEKSKDKAAAKHT